MQFVDLKAQYHRIASEIDQSINHVLKHGQFIMGPEIRELEAALSAFSNVKHAIVTSSGTDALKMVLMAKGVGPGDAIIVPSFTFIATVEVVKLVGATPIFCDVDADSFNIDVSLLESLIEKAKRQSLTLKGIIPVDLFGLPADYNAINDIAKRHGLFVLGDTAQGYGGEYHSMRTGGLTDISATSFFPAKPLGCYGDGGAVFTNDDDLADIIRSIQFHGKGKDQYDNVRIGITGRLDTMQAAILLAKLKLFEEELELRQKVADRYSEHLQDVVKVPQQFAGYRSAWAQYTIQSEKRDEIKAHLQASGIPTAIYYACPLHRQPAYIDANSCLMPQPVSEQLSAVVISLPMHPYLTEQDQDRVITAVREVCV